MPDKSHTRKIGDVLEVTSVWEFKEGVEYSQAAFRPALDPLKAGYWVAADGEVMFLDGIGSTCTANVDNAMHGLGYRSVYAIWGYRNGTKSQLDRWIKKWTARTRAGNA